MKVIFNADDFGYSRGENFGTVDTHKYGVVTQATLMANGSALEHAAELAKENPNLSIGVHLVLTHGEPIIKTHKTIVNEEGKFHSSFRGLYDIIDTVDLDEVEREWEAQIQKIIEAGVDFCSLDSHHFINTFGNLNQVFIKLAKKYDLAVRYNPRDPESQIGLLTTDDMSKEFYGENATVEKLIQIMEERKHEDIVLEFMTHPAYLDTTILNASSYNIDRVKEVGVLTSERLINYLKENDIQTTSFKEMLKCKS